MRMGWSRGVALLMSLVPFSVVGQVDEVAKRYAASISVDDLRQRLTIIASDSMEGRETGMPGQKRAARYLTSSFSGFGIPPIQRLGGYEQQYNIYVTYPDTMRMMVGSDTLRFLTDFYAFNLADMRLVAEEMTYVGHGIHSERYTDYEGMDVQGKVLLISSGEPKVKGKSLVDPKQGSTEWSSDWSRKMKEAKKRGAKALFVIDPKFSTSVVRLSRYLKGPNLDITEMAEDSGMPVVYISSEVADRLLKAGQSRGHADLEKVISKKAATQRITIKAPFALEVKRNREVMKAENVLGYLEGSDLKDELVVISCHYDHLGMKDGEIFNGADDDGSGTTALLELAETFAQAKREGNGPRRSILFIAFSGEEKGLLGSELYAREPVFPLKNTYANLNIDMIGRVDKQHEPDSNYVYLIGADKISQDLHNLSERANATYTGLKLDYTFNDESDPNRFYYRSDHYNFAKNGIPVIFYFTGVHKDYHKPTDTVEKIMFTKMQRIVQLIFHTAWELANREGQLAR
jgi:hypothetical protein